MSTNQTSLFGSSGRHITDPRQLSAMAIANDRLGLKSAFNSAVLSDNATFFTALARLGATAAITVADTWVNVLNIASGSGYVTGAVSPTHTGTGTPSIEYTIDGGAPIVIAPTAVQTAYFRMVHGPLTSYLSANAGASATTNSDLVGPNNANDGGFNVARVGGLAQVGGTILRGLPTPEACLEMGWPVLRYESSILIRMKHSNLSANAVDKQCGVAYRPDL